MAPGPLRFILRISFISILPWGIFLLPQPTRGQTRTPPPVALAFEVVSIHPSKTQGDNNIRSNRYTFSSDNTLENLVDFAFGTTMREQISGLPSWAQSAQYRIDAKIDPDTVAAQQQVSDPERYRQLHTMVQNMLVERFNLKYHHQTRDLPVYVLKVAKGGLKIKASSAQGSSSNGGRDTLKGTGMTMSDPIARLSPRVGRIIVDKTGLTGRYDLALQWSSEDDPTAGETSPSIYAAIPQQLGLKLEPGKAPIDIIVIDSLERPTGN